MDRLWLVVELPWLSSVINDASTHSFLLEGQFDHMLIVYWMEDPGHVSQRHLVLLCPEKPLQHVLLLRYQRFFLLPPQHHCQHRHFLLKLIPFFSDQNSSGHVEALRPTPGEGAPPHFSCCVWVEGVHSWVFIHRGQGLAPVKKRVSHDSRCVLALVTAFWQG